MWAVIATTRFVIGMLVMDILQSTPRLRSSMTTVRRRAGPHHRDRLPDSRLSGHDERALATSALLVGSCGLLVMGIGIIEVLDGRKAS